MNAKLLLLLVAIAGVTFFMNLQTESQTLTNQFSIPLSTIQDFKEWQLKFGKNYYGSSEFEYRLQVFYENSVYIASENLRQNEFELGSNQFMDINNEEFKAIYLGLVDVPEIQDQVSTMIYYDVPNDVDWRSKGAVTEVKNQGSCGSCWAFSTTGNLEGLSFIAKQKLQNFSEQQLVDCSTSYGNQGCNGGLMTNSFRYVKDHGIVTQSEYPYTGRQGTCKINQGPFKVSGYTEITSGQASELQAGIVKGPVSVAVDASNWSFYKGGIFSNCGTSLNHGVTAVGYTADYYIIKNSWATSWGEQGYMRLKTGNTCGVANMASYAQI